MKIIFLGSSDFSVPFLAEISKSRHTVESVITGIDKKKGRGRKALPNPVKEASTNLGIKVIEIEKFTSDIINKISNIDFDAIVCVSFGKILPLKLLNLHPGKCINLHPSLLPRYRGPSPITSTLLNGDISGGLSIIEMTEDLDAGNIFIQSKIALSPEENKDSYEQKLIFIGTPLIISVLNLIECCKIETFPQGNKSISYTSIIDKNTIRIRWASKAEKILNQVRAFSTSPGSFTTWNGKTLKIIKASKAGNNENSCKSLQKPQGKNGEIISSDRQNGLRVRCGNSEAIKVELLKPEGKKIMAGEDFINGYPIKTGDFFE